MTRKLAALGILIWAALVGFGLQEIFAYSTVPGATTDTPERWPIESRLARGDGFTIVMFVHPDCPCSRASLAELAAIVDAAAPKPAVELVLEHGDVPIAAPVDAIRTVDDGSEAARFGAATSGFTVVYDGAGELRFAGGITGSRGHAGDNVGRRAVQQILAGEDAGRSHAVFGCALTDPTERTR